MTEEYPNRVIIAGGRDFKDYELLTGYCDLYLSEIVKANEKIQIVSGTAYGADKLGERYAYERGYDLKQFPADWERYKKSAGYIRNEVMAKYAGILFAFWDGKSKGTSHMINLAKKHELQVRVINY